jgi:phosphate transport system substrate-binding protein
MVTGTKLSVAVMVGLALTGRAMAQTEIKVDGSSTVFPITEAVAEEFQAAQKKAGKDVRVTVGISGTGGGFKKFVRGEIDIADASRPILAKEMEEAKKNGIEYIELPVAFDALTVMVNPKNTWITQFTVAELKKIWHPDAQGKVMRWNEVNPAWPDQPLKLYGAGSDSGTFDYFTEAVNGKSKLSRTDYTASEDDNTLVQGIATDKNALGYFGYAYYAENQDKLKAVPVVNAEGKAIAPSPTAVKDGSYNPLARPIFIYVNKKSLDKPEVKQFVEFYLSQATALVEEVKYIPLPSNAYEAGLARLKKGEVGTCFGGHSEAGLHIDELFKRPLTSEVKATDSKK